MASYIGKWFRYSGAVRNVNVGGGKVYIRFETGNFKSIKAKIKGQLELADVLHKGENITVDGQIAEIDTVTFVLENAEIVQR